MSSSNNKEQTGGGNCSLCGSPNVTKATCPLNPVAKNPNPGKHPLATAKVDSIKKGKITIKQIAKITQTPTSGSSGTSSIGVSTSSKGTPNTINFEIYDGSLYSYLAENLIAEDFQRRGNKSATKVKIAAFDLDSTLIETKSGAQFALDQNDWKWAFQGVAEVLAKLAEDGYLLVVFTNQKGIKKGKTDPNQMAQKLSAINSQLSAKLSAVLMASHDDFYRKPMTGMWAFLETKLPDLMASVDKGASFYCGDAAGRAKNWRPGADKDFSFSDRYFAHNLGLSFKLPEQLFALDLYPQISMEWLTNQNLLQVDPYSTDELDWSRYNCQPLTVNFAYPTHEVIMMVGPPASGKSTLVQQYLNQGYIHVNMDKLKTKAKCLKLLKDSLTMRQNVIVDNTNPSVAVRKEYIDIVAEYNKQASKSKDPNMKPYKLKAYLMTTPPLVVKHLNNFRVQFSKGEIKKIPTVAYNIFKGRFETPTKAEGFIEITEVPFCVDLDQMDPGFKKEFLFHYTLS